MAGLDADVAVVGAGPAGAAAALFAAQSGRRVVVFDRAAVPRGKPRGEGLMPPGRYGMVGRWHGVLPRDRWIRLTTHAGFETYRAPVGPDEQLVALLCSHDQMASFASGLSQQSRELVLATHPDLEKAELVPGV